MLASCDSIGKDDRYIPTEDASVNTTRCVLLEEFTGQLCVNCPEGHKIISSLREQYGDRFIPVSIHAGVDRMNAYGVGQFDGVTGLALAEGEALAKQFGIETYPAGVVDRTTGILDFPAWAAAVSAAFAKPATVEINPEAKLEGNSLTVVSRIKTKSSGSARYQVYLVENGIVADQQSTGGYLTDYVHNHIFRGTLCGVDGESITLDPLLTEISKIHTVTLPDFCGHDNLSVVVFIFDSASGVLQAAEAKVEID